jgi:HD-GYP domain-containing protein (c-di-GMP phosphodiesterase class II)
MKYVRLHPLLSYTVLKETDDYSDELLEAIYHHHENMDGSGYPDNIRGEEISLGARLIRLCDTFAALVSNRHYRTAFDMQTSIELMIDEIKNFDMRLFLAFMNVVNDADMLEYLRAKGVKCT